MVVSQSPQHRAEHWLPASQAGLQDRLFKKQNLNVKGYIFF